jgi:hypothetical protein
VRAHVRGPRTHQYAASGGRSLSSRVVGARLGHDAIDKPVAELFECVDLWLGQTLRRGHASNREALRSPREGQAGVPQRRRGIGDDRPELLLLMEEQVEIASLAVLGVESGEGRTSSERPGGLDLSIDYRLGFVRG